MTTSGALPACDMAKDCTGPVTHIGSKGYAYCATHAAIRRESGQERTRRMRAWELDLIRQGKPLPAYTPGPKTPTRAATAPRALTSRSNRILAALRDYLTPETFAPDVDTLRACRDGLADFAAGRSAESEWELRLFDLAPFAREGEWGREVRHASRVIGRLVDVIEADSVTRVNGAYLDQLGRVVIDSDQYAAVCEAIDRVKTDARSLDTDEYAGMVLDAIGAVLASDLAREGRDAATLAR